MHTRFRMLAAATALGFAAPLLAQQATPDSTRAATELVDLLTPQAQAKANLDRQLTEMRQGAGIRAAFGNNPRFQMEAAKNQPSFNAALARMGGMQADTLGPILTDMQTASRQLTIETYAKTYSAEELRAILSFFRSPAGAKWVRQQPQVTAEVNRTLQQRFGPRLETAQKSVGPRVEAELKKLFPPEQGK
ncbi:MAG: DUF2059 domain-containing protein [Thermaurantiacus sp.]